MNGRISRSSVKKGDLVRIVKRIQLPAFIDEDIGKFGIITSSSLAHGAKKADWVIVLLEGKFQLHAMQNLEVMNEEG